MKNSTLIPPQLHLEEPISVSTLDRWTHPSVILVATDLSDLDRLMPFAFEQAAQTGARLLLLHVLTGAAAMLTDAAGMPYYYPAGVMQYAATTGTFLPGGAGPNIACNALVREGNAAQQIAIAARQFRADRVLLGTRSRSRLGKLLLGSVAAQVLRSVNLPVITVGPEAHLPVDASTARTRRAPRHHSRRDLSPERGACLPNCRRPSEPSWCCCMFCRRLCLQLPLHRCRGCR